MVDVNRFVDVDSWRVKHCVKRICCDLCVQEEKGISMLQREKNLRTQLEALMKEKTQRMQQLKALLEQDQDLCDILCVMPYAIAADSVPSVEQLENFRQHIANQNAEKVKFFHVLIFYIK